MGYGVVVKEQKVKEKKNKASWLVANGNVVEISQVWTLGK
jgi:hypothetical protein